MNRDRKGQVWELPTGTIFVVVGAPWRHGILGWQHPALTLVAHDDTPSVTDVQEFSRVSGAFEDRGWSRLA